MLALYIRRHDAGMEVCRWPGPRKGRRKEAERALKKLGTKEAGQPLDAFSASCASQLDIFAGGNRARGCRERNDRIAHRNPIQKARAPERDASRVRPFSIQCCPLSGSARLAATLMCRHAASIIVKMWLPVYLGTHGHVGSAVAAMLLMYLLEETWLKASTCQTAWETKLYSTF